MIVANPARDKGTKAESGVVGYLRATYWPYAERRSLAGALDKGDVTGTPGLCWEVKATSGALQWWSWMAEACVERINANAALEILVVKPPRIGYTDVSGWYAAMSDASFRYLQEDAQSQHSIMTTDPTLYRQASFAGLLRAVDLDRMLRQDMPFNFSAVTLYKPGMRDQPGTHIKVTYLRQMVRLLNEHGYGSSDAQLAPRGMQLLREMAP